MCDCPAHMFIGRECDCQCDHTLDKWTVESDHAVTEPVTEPTLYLCKYWGLDDLLYVIGEEDILHDQPGRLEDVDEFPHNIYFLVELKPV